MTTTALTYWWKRCRSREAAATEHCEATILRAVETYGSDDETPQPPRTMDYDLWESFGIDWRKIRERIEREAA